MEQPHHEDALPCPSPLPAGVSLPSHACSSYCH
ncbi:hypothetical protein E2C01_085248 [Portunus trituberculatus]|uniref:Uncharacterized protein n=1 Tax=Portunus trituberculatus TaxID=210409 RepID=A0A5B7IXC5_PORTR|nr:hypothetical protein [Portunus trituberculatus]